MPDPAMRNYVFQLNQLTRRLNAHLEAAAASTPDVKKVLEAEGLNADPVLMTALGSAGANSLIAEWYRRDVRDILDFLRDDD